MSSSHLVNWRQSLRIVFLMGWSDFLLKYRGSFLGYLWSFCAPLLKFAVIYHIFKPYTNDIDQYPLYLLLGLIIWEFFINVTTGCMAVLRGKSQLIEKVAFPRILIMFAVGWTNIIVFATHFTIFILFGLIAGLHVSWTNVYGIILFLQMLMICQGMGMLLAAFALRYRDIPHLWAVLLQVLFWLTPIFYRYNLSKPLTQTAGSILQDSGAQISLGWLFNVFITFQPLSILMNDARRVLLYPDTAGVPTMVHAVVFGVICAATLLAGILVFRARSIRFLEEL